MGALNGFNQVNQGDVTVTTTSAKVMDAPQAARHDLQIANYHATATLLVKLAASPADAAVSGGWCEVPAGTSKTLRNIATAAGADVYAKSSASNANVVISQSVSTDAVGI